MTTIYIGGHNYNKSACLGEHPTALLLRIARQLGTLADWAEARTPNGRVIALARRDPDGDGTRWYRATV